VARLHDVVELKISAWKDKRQFANYQELDDKAAACFRKYLAACWLP
jgi:hypothetical protein